MLYNDPSVFRDEMVKGYVSAFRNYLIEVPGGVVRASETPKGKVAVINGGGSGHYPAFCGIVGEGFMDGTVIGNIFTSPSADDVYHVAKAADGGSGIFIVGGNYAGDKMNFNQARDRLIAEGTDARTFYITDDIASASREEKEKRRGNVGTFTVFKTAGAAAAEGLPFDEVVRLTEKANDRTRTMSIGFRGCTLPGADGPLFHVPERKMEIGQGIHGEAGVSEADLAPAAEVAKLLVERVLAEEPTDSNKRLGVILDGLGSTKYEELFVVWKTVSELLEGKGYTLVEPLVGEFVTSLDMAGIALAVTYLDGELEHFWLAAADTPAFRRGSLAAGSGNLKKREVSSDEAESVHYEDGTEASLRAAKYIAEAFSAIRIAMETNEDELARIDSVAGDGDHGRGMVKGSTFADEAARAALEKGAAAGSVLSAAGKAWASKAGGTSGVLWGAALEAAGTAVGDQTETFSSFNVAAAARAAASRIQELGGASLGDKTMLDALIPFVETLEACASRGDSIAEAWTAAVETARKAAEKTADLLPKVGRARPQAERSLGTPDAGAVSLSICLASVCEVF